MVVGNDERVVGLKTRFLSILQCLWLWKRSLYLIFSTVYFFGILNVHSTQCVFIWHSFHSSWSTVICLLGIFFIKNMRGQLLKICYVPDTCGTFLTCYFWSLKQPYKHPHLKRQVKKTEVENGWVTCLIVSFRGGI